MVCTEDAKSHRSRTQLTMERQCPSTDDMTYVLLTRVSPENVKSPADLKTLAKAVGERVRKECPGVKWLANYALLGPYDYMDLFEAPDADTAARVTVIVRALGHAHTETWTAMSWERFERILPQG